MLSQLVAFFAFACVTSAAKAGHVSGHPIYTFPGEPSWFENIDVRSDGDLVLSTISPSASILVLSKPWSGRPQLVHNITLPNLDGALGFAEVRPNVYAVAAGKFENISNFVPRSGQVWVVDLYDQYEQAKLAATIPEAGELNGMLALEGSSEGDVLIADSTYGQIWKVSTTHFNQSSIWFGAKEMEITNTSASAWPFGINGIRYSPDGDLYFSNTNTRSIYQIEMSKEKPVGVKPVAVNIDSVAALDDFTFSHDGKTILATSNIDDKIVAVDLHTGSSRVLLGGKEDGVVAGDTAVAWGRTRRDWNKLYVATSGRAWSSDDDSRKGPAKIVAVEGIAY